MNEEIYFDLKRRFFDFLIQIKRDNCLGCELDSLIEFNHTCLTCTNYREFCSALEALRKSEKFSDAYLRRLHDEFFSV
jgi:hypothetical protein